MILILTVLLLFKAAFTANEDPVIQLPNGKILGRRGTTFANTSYFSFKKIPYAEPPVGNLRLKAPQPAQAWEGVLDADTLGFTCLQIQANVTEFDSEDCLYLNVFTPELPGDDSNVSLPVMLFIHGGGFLSGRSLRYPPDLFVDNGVIYVSISYRLGLFGFLSTQDETIPGNFGLKDQLLALQWTHDNIHLFGGDPDKITIFGESAGAASAAYHTLNQNSDGLFRGVILESGTFLCPWAFQRNSRNYAFDFAASFNSTFRDSDDSEALLQFLQSLEATDLNKAAENYVTDTSTGFDGIIFAPVIEVENPDAFVTGKMYKLVQTGNVVKVPTLIGFNSEESTYFYTDPEAFHHQVSSWDENLDAIVPSDMQIHDSLEHSEMAFQIRDIYTNGQPFGDDLGAGIRYSSDNAFVRSIIKHAELLSGYAETYFYEFSYNGQLGGPDVNYSGAGNVAHFEEIYYLFCSDLDCDASSYPESDLVTRKRLIKIWTDFAKYLNPTPEPSELLQNITWPQVSSKGGDFLYVDINERLEIKNYPRSETYSKWTALYDSLNVTEFDTY